MKQKPPGVLLLATLAARAIRQAREAAAARPEFKGAVCSKREIHENDV